MTDRTAQINEVLSLIEQGMSENAACNKVGISRSTFRTMALRTKAGDDYARALEGLALDQIEKLEKTIEDMRQGVLDPAIGRIEVDARKWFASKFLPKQFGDKVQQEVSGPDGGPVQTAAKLDVSGLTTEQLQALASVRIAE